ncbi:hypothetical protein MXB_4808 [Myxobolus squamalis]|nr:hypothetical protein MXB_4808 [Myxobolus squamalis]
MTFSYLLKIGYIETLTCNSFTQSYHILVDILTFEEDTRFPTKIISSIIALFSSQGKLKLLLKQIFQKEIDLSQDQNTLFRSSSLAAIFKKYPNSALTSVSSIFFLRLINPFLINAKISSSSAQSDQNKKRALMMLSKVLQSIANKVLNKEPSMEPLNVTAQSNFDDMNRLCMESNEEFSPLSIDQIKNMIYIQKFITPRISHLLKFLFRLASVTKKLQDLSDLSVEPSSILFSSGEKSNF